MSRYPADCPNAQHACAQPRRKGQDRPQWQGHDKDVLHDADTSLACWLAGVLPGGTKVRFGAPDAGWVSRPPDPPFLDAFLYDIREDGDQARPAGWSAIRDTDGKALARQMPPRHYRLRYLVTAWTAGVAPALPGNPPLPGNPEMTEHELLGDLMCACASLDALPADCLHGSLADAALPVLLRCAPADRDADPARCWAGFGLPPRVFLDLLLLVPLLPPPDTDLAPLAREIALDMTKPGAEGNGKADDNIAAGRMTGRPLAEELPAGRRTAGAPGRRREPPRITEHAVPPGQYPVPQPSPAKAPTASSHRSMRGTT